MDVEKCECEKRDFHTNKTLTERVERLEAAVFDREQDMDFVEVQRTVPSPEEVQKQYNRRKTAEIYAADMISAPDRARDPIDLLREFRAGFEAEAKHFCERASRTPDRNEELAMRSKAFAAESAVKRIDATLRDWA